MCFSHLRQLYSYILSDRLTKALFVCQQLDHDVTTKLMCISHVNSAQTFLQVFLMPRSTLATLSLSLAHCNLKPHDACCDVNHCKDRLQSGSIWFTQHYSANRRRIPARASRRLSLNCHRQSVTLRKNQTIGVTGFPLSGCMHRVSASREYRRLYLLLLACLEQTSDMTELELLRCISTSMTTRYLCHHYRSHGV